jgi:DNA-binding MarR family transcriptional regulator
LIEKPLTDADFEVLAAFRAGLRRFMRFSEEAAREAGLTPQQHQLLVAIRGHAGDEPPTIGDLAEALQIRHHSAVELVDRVEQRGFVSRGTSAADNRRVHVSLTRDGETVLRQLTAAHRREHRQLAAIFRQLQERLEPTFDGQDANPA